jgi:phosphoglycolate phosphatase-like HAD superfamily hydrolase
MDLLDVDPADVLYIGDSQVDIQCARRAGASGGAALWGSLNHIGLLKEAPDYAFGSITELLTELPAR